jgi:hypothetical protein
LTAERLYPPTKPEANVYARGAASPLGKGVARKSVDQVEKERAWNAQAKALRDKDKLVG